MAAPNPKRSVFLFVYEPPHFTELRRVAECLRASGRYRPVLYFVRRYPVLERDVDVCRADGFELVAPDGGRPGPQVPASTVVAPGPLVRAVRTLPESWRRPIRWVAARWREGPLPLKLLPALRHFRTQVRRAEAILRAERPALLVFTEENVGFREMGPPVLIKTGRRMGVPSLVVPYTVANAEELANHLFDQHPFGPGRLENRMIGRLYPRWVYAHRGRRLLRMTAADVVAMEWLNLVPRDPWQVTGGEADAVAVESEFMREYYRRERLPEDRLVMTGALYDDVLATGLREAEAGRAGLYAELGLPPGVPMILCALPPEQVRPQARTGFVDYRELLRFWIDSLASVHGFNVVVRPHPSLPRDSLAAMEGRHVRLCWRDTASLVPLCDLYVASISATIRWALACGKPVLNYDVYRFRYSDFADAPGCLTVEEPDDFRATLARLTHDGGLRELAARQARVRERWGLLDGRARERLLRLVDRLAGGAPIR